MQWFRRLVRKSPKRWLMLGKAVFLAGSILVLGAVFARAGLPEAWPLYPGWLLPRGPVGYTVAAVLVLAGMVLTSVAADEVRRSEGRRF